jgi:hypothetical protein
MITESLPPVSTTSPYINPHPHRLSLVLCYSVCVFGLQFYTYVNHGDVWNVGTVEV